MQTKAFRTEYKGHERWNQPTRLIEAEILQELNLWMLHNPAIIHHLHLNESKTAPDGYVELLIEYEAKQ